MHSALSLRVTFSVVVILLPLTSSGASMDFKETILDLMEGSTLNFTTEVEVSSLQSIYVCVTKSLSITLEDFDLNATLSAGGCVVCDSNDIVQNCIHRFNSSRINVMINQLQNDSESVQLVNFFKENVSVDDDGTKILCAYEAGNTTLPCSWIYLNVHSLPTPENPINILVPVVISSSTVIALLVILLIMATTAICVHKHKRRIRISSPIEVDSQPQALDVAERIAHHSQYLHYIIDDKYSSPLQPQAFGIVERITYHGQDLHHDNIDEENLPPLQAQAPIGVTERIVCRDQYSESPCSSVAEVLVNLRGVGWLQPPIHHRHLPSFDVLGLLHHQSHSDELISVDIDWPDTESQNRADTESSSESGASLECKVSDLPDHISSRDDHCPTFIEKKESSPESGASAESSLPELPDHIISSRDDNKQ